MGLQLRCNCGWNSQVSEFYLGDRVACPDCGVKLNVHGQSGVPYGYAPYPTWQKRTSSPPTTLARRRDYPPTNPHASPAFWLGLFSLLFALTGCGAIPAALLALFGVNSWCKSRHFVKAHKRRRDAKATIGLALSCGALLVCAGLAYGAVGSTGCHHPARCGEARQIEPAKPVHEFRYEQSDREWYTQQAERLRAQNEEWKRIQSEQGYRYPVVEPEQTPAAPGNDSQRYQQEPSKRTRKERVTNPGYRYSD